MARKEREILELRPDFLAEEAVKADELVDEAKAAGEEIIRSRSTRRCCGSSS
jgi:hypothetical protein